jgi:tetratricopeptide (TPR) repeat protein
MTARSYRYLKYTAIGLTLAWVSWTLYGMWFAGSEPGDYAYHAGSNYFTDGNYSKALQEYEKALLANPTHRAALRGRGETLIMLNREPEAIETYTELIALESDNGGHYANRGIAYDRTGKHQEALADYENALRLDPEIGEGPGWLTRFLRKQPEKPPGIAERAGYIKAQLALPVSERVLYTPDIDTNQRPYKK